MSERVRSIGEVVAAYYRALRSQDAEALAGLLADDVVCFDPLSRPALEGRSEVFGSARELASALPDLGMTEENIFVCGDGAAVHWSARVAKPDAHVEGITVFEVNDDGLIQSLWGYWDPTDLEEKLGCPWPLIPPVSITGDRDDESTTPDDARGPLPRARHDDAR